MRKSFHYLMLTAMLACTTTTHALDHIDLPENSFVALTFHDVRDDVKAKGDRDLYAISTKNLSGFLDWMKSSGWHAISLKQLEQAKLTGQDLPENAVILCFDDGALSSYTHVYPLLKHYQVPAVFAIPTSWINGNNKDAYTAYGEGNLMTWDQMREMQTSGLVEFASHSDDLHKGILANPQQNQKPAAIYRLYLPELQRYETQVEFEQRIYQDIKKSKQILDHELGIDSKAMIWPYGAVNQEVADIAKRAGLPVSFSLGKSVANDKQSTLYQRVLIIDNPSAEDIHGQIHDVFKGVDDPLIQPLRSIEIHLAELETAHDQINSNGMKPNSYAASDQKLGEFLQQIDSLKSNMLWLDVTAQSSASAVVDKVYFETAQNIPIKLDFLSRTNWQARTRVNQYVIANLPMQSYAIKDQVIQFSEDIIKYNPSINAINLEAPAAFACVWSSQLYQNTECQTQVTEWLTLQAQVKQAVSPYLNVSGNYFSVLSIALNESSADQIKLVLQNLTGKTELLNLKVDILKDTKFLKPLLHALSQLDQSIKQHIHISLALPENLDASNAKILQEAFTQLRRQGIQKMGVSDYHLKDAKTIHQLLYPALSLNNSPVTYREP